MTNRDRDYYKKDSWENLKQRKPILRDLRDSNYLEHFAKTISYIDHTWNQDGTDRHPTIRVLLKKQYSQNTSESANFQYDNNTGFYYNDYSQHNAHDFSITTDIVDIDMDMR